MEKIIVRNMVLGRGYINSAYISLCQERTYDSAESFLNEYGINLIMRELYNEDIFCKKLVHSVLYKSYCEILQTDKDNENFKIMYKIDKDFAVHLTENIYIYHLSPKGNEVYSTIVPWFYADGKSFVGDTWWEDDDEILENLKRLSIIEFMRKYKGC